MGKKVMQEDHIKDSEFICYFSGAKIKGIKPKVAFGWALAKVKKIKSGKNYCRLGNCYDFGIGVKKDVTKANKYYLLAAKKNDTIAQYNIAFSYYIGEGIKKNFKKSFYWMVKAARRGDKEALADLGYYYIQGIGTKPNSKKAFFYYQKAAKEKVPRAFYNLGLMYEAGDGVAQNDKKAREFFKTAKKLGHRISKVRQK